MSERIHKYLADQGLGSRREIERWIEAGRVKVNGKPAVLGQQVTGRDSIQVDGKRITTDDRQAVTRVLIYHKPLGEIVARKDPQNRPTVFEKLPTLRKGRWIAVGRLDINTSGLLLLTNNGELAKRLMHPSFQITRTYAVRVFGGVTDEQVEQLRKGVVLEDGEAKFDRVQAMRSHLHNSDDEEPVYGNYWYECELKEGRNREVRRLWEAVDTTVSRLTRIRYGQVKLPKNLSRGKYQDLPHGVVNQLLENVDMPMQDKAQWYDSPERKVERPSRLKVKGKNR